MILNNYAVMFLTQYGFFGYCSDVSADR